MRAKEFLPENKGLPNPGTYEQEYGAVQKRGPRRLTAMTNEALDSSYQYTPSEINPANVFYFTTDSGEEYKVQFAKSGKAVEVSFYAKGNGDEHKIGITGGGDSRKIFGTVVNIVKEYLNKNKPLTLLFTAVSNEPSRVRLYKALASKVDQSLPDYYYAGSLHNGNFVQFNIKHNEAPKISNLEKAKAAGWKALNAIAGAA